MGYGEVVRLTQGSPPVLLLMLPETTANRIEEETPKRGGAEGGRFTGSTEDSGPVKPGNSVEDKTLTIRKGGVVPQA
jgi:hypothetical protein